MSRFVGAVAAIGAASDTVVAAARAALADRRSRRVALVAGVAALLLYVWAIGDIVVGSTARPSGAALVQLAPEWTERIFRPRAPYLFEPVLAVHPLAQLTVLVSPVNLALGGVLAALVGLNLAVATHAAPAACRPTGYGRLLGMLPALLVGMACCAPTFLVALGSGTAAVLLPVALPLRTVFYPLSVALLAGTLVWGVRRSGVPSSTTARRNGGT